jgi:hypothetical protein
MSQYNVYIDAYSIFDLGLEQFEILSYVWKNLQTV